MWPKDLQLRLEKLKDTASIAFPKKKSKEKSPLLISPHGASGKTWNIEEQLKRSAKFKGL